MAPNDEYVRSKPATLLAATAALIATLPADGLARRKRQYAPQRTALESKRHKANVRRRTLIKRLKARCRRLAR